VPKQNPFLSEYDYVVILLIGRHGNLSLAAQNYFRESKIHIVDSEVATAWYAKKGLESIGNYFDNFKVRPELIVNTSGIVNPQAELSKLLDVNYYLPRNLNIFSQRSGIKLVTFGTIMENNLEISNSNAYLYSKRRYFEYLLNQQVDDNSLHLQVHTWYGGDHFHDHMFLSQIYNALKRKISFGMSGGTQFREYHHINDDLAALKFLLDQKCTGVHQINHGEAISLRDLAEFIFGAYGLLELLKVNKLKIPAHEVLQKKYLRNKALDSIHFRDTRVGVLEYFTEFQKESNDIQNQ
jgi:nucleoside-diphosphate-sugar epimerase